jgi:N-acetylneuraminate synthase
MREKIIYLMEHKCYTIAEVGQAHEGSLGLAHSYIDAIAKTGADAVKFQMHIAESESSVFEKFRVNFSYEDKTRFDYWKRMEFTIEQWDGLKRHCEEVGLDFICSPFSMMSVDILEKMNLKAFKIGSGEAHNKLLLERVAKIGKPIFLSNGLSNDHDLLNAISWIKPFNSNLSLFQCTTKYPTYPEDWGLNNINLLKKKFGLPVGYSDHSGDIFSCLAACTLGAEFLEFHVVFDKQMFGPDSTSSLTFNQTYDLIKGVNAIIKSKNSLSVQNTMETELKNLFGKSLCVNKDMNKGEKISINDLETKKPFGKGIDTIQFDQIIGKSLNKSLKKWSFINFEDINI